MNASDRALALEMFKVTKDGREVAPPEIALQQLEDVCARTGVDWKSRGAYLINRSGRWRCELSIDGFRAIAASDEKYAGQEGPFWTMGADQPWTDIPPDGKPYAAKVGVRMAAAGGGSFTTWGIAKYADYATGPMWGKFPSTMIAKCAEMLALRKALPGRLGGLYGAEEMDQAGGKKAASKAKESDSPTAPPPSESSPAHDFIERMDEAKSVEELLGIGRLIQGSKLGLNEKMELSKIFKIRKAQLEASDSVQKELAESVGAVR